MEVYFGMEHFVVNFIFLTIKDYLLFKYFIFLKNIKVSAISIGQNCNNSFQCDTSLGLSCDSTLKTCM